MNATYHDSEYWFSMIGQAPIFDYLYMYSLVPFFLIAFGFGLLSYWILLKKEFNKNSFFKYMRAYALNSLFLFAILTTTFIPFTKRVFKFTNTNEAIFYGWIFYLPWLSVFYINSSFIEICIVTERLLYFLPAKYKRIKVIGFNKFCIILFVVSLVISLPNYFLFYPAYMDVMLDKDTPFRVFLWGNTEFSLSLAGLIVTWIMYFLRDILGLVVKIVLNIKLVIMVRNYLNKIKLEKLAFAQKISSGLELHDKIAEAPSNLNNSGYISKTERNQTYIALFMCISSLFHHLLYTLSYILYFSNRIDIAGIILYLALIALGVKHVFKFFILYKYKYLFRAELKKSLKNVFLNKNDSS